MDIFQFKFVTLMFFFSLCFIVPFSKANDVHYCDSKAYYDVQVKGVEIVPNPVARGQPATFRIAASTGKVISGGKLVIDVSYFGLHVHSETRDLCRETSCPASVGDFVFSHTQVLPGYTPPGSYTLKMKMYDGNGHELTCIGFGFSIGFATDLAES